MLLDVAEFVGFLAHASRECKELKRGDPLLFPGVLTNAGGAYDSSTSSFTCPVTAHYYVYYSLLLVRQGRDEHCSLVVMRDAARVAAAVRPTVATCTCTSQHQARAIILCVFDRIRVLFQVATYAYNTR